MSSSKSRHYAGIDVARIAAALMVMVHHLGLKAWLRMSDPLERVADTPPGQHVPALYAWIGGFGWMGVEIFFVISGLVIARSAAGTSARDFIKGRVARLYPAAWICGTLSALILLAVGVTAHLGMQYAGALTLFPGITVSSGFTVYWTLSMEVIFYALVALILFKSNSTRALEALAILLLAWSGAYLLAHLTGWRGYADDPDRERLTLWRYGVFFAIGILLWANAEKAVLWRGALIALGAGLGGFELTLSTFPGDYGTRLCVWLAAVAFIALSVSPAAQKIPLSPGFAKFLRRAGLATYPLYLMHEEVGGVAIRLALRSGVAPAAASTLGMACAIAASFAISLLAERPLRAWLRAVMDHAAPSRPIAKPGADQ